MKEISRGGIINNAAITLATPSTTTTVTISVATTIYTTVILGTYTIVETEEVTFTQSVTATTLAPATETIVAEGPFLIQVSAGSGSSGVTAGKYIQEDGGFLNFADTADDATQLCSNPRQTKLSKLQPASHGQELRVMVPLLFM